ncbi:MAG: hypothetical protein RJB13_236, partial [Pseudomonadota bacterium]
MLESLKYLLKYRCAVLTFASVIVSVALLFPTSSQAAYAEPEKSDLAVIFSPEGRNRIFATQITAPMRQALLPEHLIRQVEDSYLNTSVGDAVSRENNISDWMLVSARVVPCSPLGLIPGPQTEVLCWPEVRLVWQPVLKDFKRYTAILSWFADDRAIHSLYDVPASLGLSARESVRAEQLLDKIKTALDSSPTGVSGRVSESEVAEFVSLRNRVAQSLLANAILLRSGNYPNIDYTTIDERPEFRDPTHAETLIANMRTFLSKTTSFEALK